MANFLSNDIDFCAYMDLTEHDQRVIGSGSYAEDVVSYFWDETTPRGEVLPWEKALGKIAFRPSEVTLWAGFNGHGKSLALGQLVVGLIGQATTSCIASLEMKPVITLARMCRQAAGSSKPDADFIREFHKLTDKCIWVYDQQGTVSADKMIGVMRYCAEVKGIKHFVLDSLLKCSIADDDYTRQKHFVDGMCTVARDTGMHIHFVAHSRKAKDENTPPGKMDVKGSGSITDQVDNVITWWRNKSKEDAIRTGKEINPGDPDAVLICDKQRNGDWEGKLGFWFDPASLQFVENESAHPMNMLRRRA
jgi:twinkle protein